MESISIIPVAMVTVGVPNNTTWLNFVTETLEHRAFPQQRSRLPNEGEVGLDQFFYFRFSGICIYQNTWDYSFIVYFLSSLVVPLFCFMFVVVLACVNYFAVSNPFYYVTLLIDVYVGVVIYRNPTSALGLVCYHIYSVHAMYMKKYRYIFFPFSWKKTHCAFLSCET